MESVSCKFPNDISGQEALHWPPLGQPTATSVFLHHWKCRWHCLGGGGASTSQEGAEILSTHRLKSTGVTSQTWTTPSRMTRCVDTAVWKGIWNTRQKSIVVRFSKIKLESSRLYLAEIAVDSYGMEAHNQTRHPTPVSCLLSKILLSLSTKWTSCSVVLCLGRQ